MTRLAIAIYLVATALGYVAAVMFATLAPRLFDAFAVVLR